MKKLLLLAVICATLHADPTAVAVVNVNSGLVSLLHNGMGFPATQPYAEVLILHPNPAADGYRIQLTFFDSAGVRHDLIRDTVSQPTSDDRPILEIFYIDAASASATATPYKLQPGSIATP